MDEKRWEEISLQPIKDGRWNTEKDIREIRIEKKRERDSDVAATIGIMLFGVSLLLLVAWIMIR